MVVAAVLLGGGLSAVPASADAGGLSNGVADDGARVVSEQFVEWQKLDITIDSPAMKGRTPVRLLLPKDYFTQPNTKWPTLYLLHGCCEPQDYKSWTAFTDVYDFFYDKNVLVVMPSDGLAGYYSDPLRGGGPKYETYHITELQQIIERGYRGSSARAIAGLSVGGFGAFSYAARHPGMFKAAASYSGLLDTLTLGAPTAVEWMRNQAGEARYSLWGDPILNRGTWAAHNPASQLAGLRGTKLYVSCGDGRAADLDQNDNFVWQETAALLTTQSFLTKARLAGLSPTVRLYGKGTHTWPYWQREFKNSWPLLAGALGVPA
ncbi:esterase family protein [Cryptosporangium phraense]|uniref:Esterase family protein n=2 Tax=Cryptosporangium phraense TaxID=2593070 RepID=A0A545AY06_9ACTN|nr:esterase family protein [Cryptosporangium phraense]